MERHFSVLFGTLITLDVSHCVIATILGLSLKIFC